MAEDAGKVRRQTDHAMAVLEAMEIDAIARQAFIEGAYRAITGLQDEREAMRKLGIKRPPRPCRKG